MAFYMRCLESMEKDLNLRLRMHDGTQERSEADQCR
jgi:hypothetical protein